MITELPLPTQRLPWTTRQSGWVGIDIGTAALKLAQVKRVGSQWQLASSLIVLGPEQLDSIGQTGGSEWMQNVIRSSLMSSGFQGRSAACVLPMSISELRTLPLPSGTDEELRRMIALELVADGEVDDDREFDFWYTVGPSAVGQEMVRVNVLSLQRHLAEEIANDLLRSDLRCRVLDGLPFALCRAVSMVSAGTGNSPVAAVDWGYRTPLFVSIVGGVPAFTRCLRGCGLEQMMQSVMDGLHLSHQECYQLLSTYGLPGASHLLRNDLEQAIAELATPLFNQFVEELNRTLTYLKQQPSGLAPQRIWLFGGGATIRNIADLLTERLQIPTSVWQLSGRSQATNPREAMLGPAIALSALVEDV